MRDDAIFGTPSSHSSFSDVSGSPTSLRPRPQSGSLVPEATQVDGTEVDGSLSSAFDRNRSRSVPTRRRPSSAGIGTRWVGLDGTEVISEREQSVDSGLEACSLTSVDSCASLQYSGLEVSAICILEAVRCMLGNDDK